MKHGRRRKAHGDRAPFAAPQAPGKIDRAVGAGQDGARVVKELRAGLRQGDAAGQAQEQRRADFALQLLDLLAERRLADAQAGGRPSEVKFLGNGGEVTQVAQFHRFYI